MERRRALAAQRQAQVEMHGNPRSRRLLCVRSCRCCQYGWVSTWWITGVTPVASMISSSCSAGKFETPMERTLPAFCASMRAFHVST